MNVNNGCRFKNFSFTGMGDSLSVRDVVSTGASPSKVDLNLPAGVPIYLKFGKDIPLMIVHLLQVLQSIFKLVLK
jgi:hypothetical protein